MAKKSRREFLTKQLKLKLINDLERSRIEEDLKFLKSTMTDRVATFGVKDARFHRKKISCERISKEKTFQKPPSSTSTKKIIQLTKLDEDNEDEDLMPQKSPKRLEEI